MIILCIAFFGSAIALVLKPDPWAALDEKAMADAALFDDLGDRYDRVGWRLTEDLTLKRVIIWGEDSKLRYPSPIGFTPLIYKFSEQEIRTLTAQQSETTAPTWNWFDTERSELIHCRPTPSLCLLYNRIALEEAFDLKSGTLLRKDKGLVAAVILFAFAILCASALIWLRRVKVDRPTGFTIVPERHSAKRGSLEVQLSPRDLKLLALLDAKEGAVATKDELYDAGWGRSFMPNSRALDQHMINLRRKLDPDKSRPVLIETVHGVGYRLVK